MFGVLKAANSYFLITNNFILFLKENSKQIWVCVVKEEHVMLTNQEKKSQPLCHVNVEKSKLLSEKPDLDIKWLVPALTALREEILRELMDWSLKKMVRRERQERSSPSWETASLTSKIGNPAKCGSFMAKA